MAFALGRRSEFPLIRYISIGFIEFWRGVPLITVLFMSAVMFPMFLPDDFFIDKLVRAIIAIALFEAAYVAEVVYKLYLEVNTRQQSLLEWDTGKCISL